MSLDGDYDDGNIFARILRGEIPNATIFEDDKVLAFMDAFPQTRGHALVVHKVSKARNLLDVEPQALEELILAVQTVARAIRAALKPDGITINQFNGATGGQTIFHLHFHVLPRWDGVPLGAHRRGQADPAELADLAARIGAELR